MNDLWFFLKLYRRHKGMLFLGIILAVITLIASLGLLALSGWFITATSLAGIVIASAKSFDFFTPGAGVRGFSILRTASRYGERLISHDATFRLLSWLREWFFSKLLPLSLVGTGRYRKGDLLHRLVADVDALDQLYLRLLSPLVSALLMSIIIAGFVSFFSKPLALFALFVMVLWIVLTPLLFFRLGNKVGQSLGNSKRDLRQYVLDHLQGMGEGLIFGYHIKSRGYIHDAERQLHADQRRMAYIDGLGSSLFVMGSGVAAVCMLWLASGEFQSHHISGPVMAMMVFVTLASFEALMPLPAAFQFLSHTRQAAIRLKEIVEEPPITFRQQADTSPITGNICFDNLCFAYGGEVDNRPVVKNLYLDIASGEHVALLGKTGCGKSTLIRLLNRGLEATTGAILLDDHLLPSLSEKKLYNAITFVSQRTHVFSGSLRDNLLLAAPHADDQQLETIILQAGLNQLGAGSYHNMTALLNTCIGQGGVILSGGEQRRLAIARALLKPAPILVMDEPTEGMDAHSEKALLDIVLEAFSASTVIMITHKKIMLEKMDNVYLMDNGCIASHIK